jgi:hypothetical protein
MVEGLMALLDLILPSWSGAAFALWPPGLPILIWIAAFTLSYAVFFLWLPRYVRRVAKHPV